VSVNRGRRDADFEAMTDPVHPAIGELLPRPSRAALVGGGLFAILALVLLDGGIAIWAQITARNRLALQSLAAVDKYSLDQHLLAMIALSLLTVGLACTLIRTKQPLLAMLVLIGVCAGPMAILAAPVNQSLISRDLEDTLWWWHALVQGGQLLVLVLWTWWTTRCLRGRRIFTAAMADPALPDQHHGAVSSELLFALYTAVTLTAQILTRPENGIESPGLLVMFGWAMLGAAGAVLVVQSSWWPMSGTIFVSEVLMLGMLYDAYYRPGGWPGVAGWESGPQSPVILSFSTSACVLAGPLIGAVLRRRHPPSGAPADSVEPQSASKGL
jgi:hypothetical protein